MASAHHGTGDGRRGTGQALVEFAIVLPILAILLGAIYQFAIIFERQIGIQNAIREDARRAAALVTEDNSSTPANNNADTNAAWAFHELWCTPTTNPVDPCYGHSHLLYDNVQDYSNGTDTLKNIQVCYKPGSGTDPLGNVYAVVDVTVSYGHPLFLPIISGILDGLDGTADDHFAISSSVEFRVENQQQDNLFTPNVTASHCSP